MIQSDTMMRLRSREETNAVWLSAGSNAAATSPRTIDLQEESHTQGTCHESEKRRSRMTRIDDCAPSIQWREFLIHSTNK